MHWLIPLTLHIRRRDNGDALKPREVSFLIGAILDEFTKRAEGYRPVGISLWNDSQENVRIY
jgi:hypothetical protein